MSGNPRNKNGARRRAIRKRHKAIGAPCWLCGKPIDYSLPAGHPMSFEVDEVVPVSLGGSPIEWENTRPAHRICNQRRGNKPVRINKAEEHEAVDTNNTLEQPLPRSRDWLGGIPST